MTKGPPDRVSPEPETMTKKKPTKKPTTKIDRNSASMAAGYRNRIKRLAHVAVRDLKPHPKNWREHSEVQKAALQGVLKEFGWVDAIMVRELGRGKYQIIDGHLRANQEPDDVVPVLVVDVTEAEADGILATFDPLAAMATMDGAMLESLLAGVEVDDVSVQAMLSELADAAGLTSGDDDPEAPGEFPEFDEDIETEHTCPKCGYAWSGGK